MYYNEILDKMLQEIFILLNNKNTERYKHVFLYIKSYIDKLYQNRYIKYKFETFATNFVALYESFNEIFNENNNIKHIGCYFHYILNIRKYLSRKRINKKNYHNIYNNVLDGNGCI